MRPVALAVLQISMAALAGSAYAQRDDIAVDAAALVPDPVAARLQAARAVQMPGLGAAPAVRLEDDPVYQWVVGAGTRPGATIQIEARLRSKIDEIAYLCAASEEQTKAMELAGRVDIWRFNQRVEELRRYIQETRGRNNLEMSNQFQRLRDQLLGPGLFGNESMFGKTVRTVLSPEQFERTVREHTSYQHRAHVERATSLLKDALKLSDRQEESLVKLLLAETRPPRQPGVYTFHVAMLEMKRVPESKLKPLFDEQQWDLLTRQFEQVKWMEPYLKENGFLHETTPPSKPYSQR